MADVSAGALQFEITADNSQFMKSVKQAQEAQKTAAAEMGQKFADASKKAETAFGAMLDKTMAKTVEVIKKIQDIGSKVGDAINGGAEGAEALTTDLFNQALKGTEGVVQKLVASLPIVGKFLSTIWDLVASSGAMQMIWEKIGKTAAGALDGLLEKAKPQLAAFSVGLRDTLVATGTASKAAFFFDPAELDKEQKEIKSWADGVKKTFEEMVEGIQTALQKIAGTWKGIRAAVQEALDKMEARTTKIEFQTSIMGLDPKAKAMAQAERTFIEESGKALKDLNEKEKEALALKLEQAGAAVEDQEARKKEIEDAKRYEQAIVSVIAALKRQGDTMLANAGMGFGKSAYDREAERARAMADGYGRGRNGGLAGDARVSSAIADAAEKAQQAANLKFNYELADAVKQQSAAYDLQTRSLGVSAGEAERMKFVQQEINKAYKDGVPLTDSLRSSIEAAGMAMGRAAQDTAQAKQRFEEFKAVGHTVASSLEGAFGKWIDGTQVKWKEFMAGLEADLAKLAFKKGVESLLTGTAASGGGLMSLLGGFGGFFADGGSVGGGSPIVVGERGPELFVPRSSGTIVPNGAMGGGGTTNITMRIDLAGANGDEAIARISAAAARQAAQAAIMQSQDSQARWNRIYRALQG